MGRISHYQRRQLASEAVGVLPPDKSGQIIAQGVQQFVAGAGKLANTLQQRQSALDNLKATKAFANFLQQDTLLSANLQKEFDSKPEAFLDQYKEQSNALKDTVGQELDGEAKERFNLAVEKYWVGKAKDNSMWVFNQQNANALNDAYELGQTFVDNAMTLSSSDEYLTLAQSFKQTAEGSVKPIISSKSFSTYTKKMQRNMALSFLNGQKTTNPIGLEQELTSNRELINHLRKVLGEEKFQSEVKQVKKFRQSFIKDLGFQTVLEGKELSTQILNQIMTNPSSFSYAQASQQHEMLVNQLNKMKAENTDGRFDEAIKSQQKTVKAFEYIKQITARLEDANIPRNRTAVSDLIKRVSKLQKEFKGEKEQPLLPRGWAGAMTQGFRWRQAATGKTATKTYSEYIKNLFDIQIEAYKMRANGEINNTDLQTILNSVIVPLSEAQEFDTLVSGGGVKFDKAWNSFDSFVDNVYNNTPLADEVKTQMVRDYMTDITKIKDMGGEITDVVAEELIEKQKLKLMSELYPEFIRVQPGSSVNINGIQRTFKGWDYTTGQPVFEPPVDIDKELSNL